MGGIQNKKKNILIIDPDREFCKALSLFLQDHYNVEIRLNLKNIEPAIVLRRIDLLIINAEYSEQELFRLIETVRKKYPQLKIIIMYTVFPTDKISEQLLVRDSDAIITKPFRAEALREKMDDLLCCQAPTSQP